MTLVIPAGYCEVAFHHKPVGSLREAVCTLGLGYGGTDLATDAIAVQNAWANRVTPSMADNWKYTQFTARIQAGTVYDASFLVGGTTSHPPTTPNVAFLIKKVTGAPGRKNRGRMYLPGVSEQDVDSLGVVVGSKITEIDAGLVQFQADILTAGFQLALLHNDATPVTGINSLKTQALCATQRRRLRG